MPAGTSTASYGAQGTTLGALPYELRYHAAPIPMTCTGCARAIEPAGTFWTRWYPTPGGVVSDADEAFCSPRCAHDAEPAEDLLDAEEDLEEWVDDDVF